MRPPPAATDETVIGWGSSALRRATLTLAIAQLVSWGVLFYGFAVAATNARIQRASTLARAAAPLVLGIAATALGWPLAWAGCLAAFAAAGERYAALGRFGRD
jgi:hypothetical protein